jgi:hypothetical protein
MGWLKRSAVRERTFAFQQCPGCSYDFVTGEGARSCGWFECPYLPDDLKVFCPECNYDFATCEGTPGCGETPSCEWAAEGIAHAENAHRFFEH